MKRDPALYKGRDKLKRMRVILAETPDISIEDLMVKMNMSRNAVYQMRWKLNKKAPIDKTEYQCSVGDIRDEVCSAAEYEGAAIMSIQDIAETTGMTEEQVKYLLRSALQKCKYFFIKLGVTSFSEERVINGL